MRKILIFMLMLMLPALAQSQFIEESSQVASTSKSGFGMRPAPTPFSLLDFSRVRWSHSYSVSYFSSGPGSSTTGLLSSTMFYDFSPKLSLALNLGLVHDPGALFGNRARAANSSLLPGFALDYHPSDKFRMSIIFQQFNSGNSPYYGRSRGLFGSTSPY